MISIQGDTCNRERSNKPPLYTNGHDINKGVLPAIGNGTNKTRFVQTWYQDRLRTNKRSLPTIRQDTNKESLSTRHDINKSVYLVILHFTFITVLRI